MIKINKCELINSVYSRSMNIIESNTVTLEGNTLHYTQIGNGHKIIITFHGFGQDHSSFGPLALSAPGSFCFYNFDLFFHGQSKWADNSMPISPEKLQKMMEIFFTENKINSFSLMTFSIGAKYGAMILEKFANNIQCLYFIAPEGLIINPWYKLATCSSASRFTFSYLLNHPGQFNRIIKLLKTAHFISTKQAKIVNYAIRNPENSQQLLNSWLNFRYLKVHKKTIIKRINTFSIETYFILAEHDPIISKKKLVPFINKLTNASLINLSASHNDLLKHATSWFLRIYK